jgi:hypothetical protein
LSGAQNATHIRPWQGTRRSIDATITRGNDELRKIAIRPVRGVEKPKERAQRAAGIRDSALADSARKARDEPVNVTDARLCDCPPL